MILKTLSEDNSNILNFMLYLQNLHVDELLAPISGVGDNSSAPNFEVGEVAVQNISVI